MTGTPAPEPLAVALAASLGLDLSRVAGSGPGCQVTADDVRSVAARRDFEAKTRHLAAVPAPGSGSLTTGGRLAGNQAVAAENVRVAVADPAVRYLADVRGVYLSRVRGTGPNGAITRSDVLDAAAVQDQQRAAAQRRAFRAPQAAPEPRITFTASGLPVSVLEEVPPSVRRALAAAPDHATAFALVEKYRGFGDPDARAALARDRSVSCDYGGLGPSRRNLWG